MSPEPRCPGCATAHIKRWHREAIVAAIQEWAATYGEPPALADWNPTACRHLGDPQRAARYVDSDGHWPSHMKVFDEFGSWNAAMLAAGFEPREAHGGGANAARQRSVRAKVAV